MPIIARCDRCKREEHMRYNQRSLAFVAPTEWEFRLGFLDCHGWSSDPTRSICPECIEPARNEQEEAAERAQLAELLAKYGPPQEGPKP